MTYRVKNGVGTTIAQFATRALAETFMHAVLGYDKDYVVEAI
jgi:hypothetical protein